MDQEGIRYTRKKGKKRERHPEKWKRNLKKKERYSSHEMPTAPTCNHSKGAFQCNTLTQRDIQHFHASFYNVPNKIVQDNFLLKYTKARFPKRPRSRKNPQSKETKKQCCIKYFVERGLEISTDRKRSMVPVCRRTFLGILKVSTDRIQRISKVHLKTGLLPVEKRGGDRYADKFLAMKVSMKNFIGQLKQIDTHYCRGQAICRQYVSSDLNVSKMWKHYNDDIVDNLKVNNCYFRNFFNKNFNIGFGTPATDVCFYCIALKEKIKRAKTEIEKTQSITKKRIHRLRAVAFYNILKEKKDNCIMFSYDSQRNLILPKVPDQAAYYMRQLYYYNFTICCGTSKDSLTKENVFQYVWKETDAAKGSNEIASAVYHRFCNTQIPSNVEEVKLVSDGCGGQNKNCAMVTMVSYWLFHDAPKHILLVSLIFPVVGHSFIPPDRIFCRIEKVITRKETVIHSEEYLETFKEHGSVIRHVIDAKIYNWKEMSSETLKSPSSWHFKLNQMKRVFIKRTNSGSIVMRGEPNYRTDVGNFEGIFKKGKSCSAMNRSELQSNVKVKIEKLKDVNTLLKKHFGENWREDESLQYYKNVIDKEGEEEEQVEEILCEPRVEEETTV